MWGDGKTRKLFIFVAKGDLVLTNEKILNWVNSHVTILVYIGGDFKFKLFIRLLKILHKVNYGSYKANSS